MRRHHAFDLFRGASPRRTPLHRRSRGPLRPAPLRWLVRCARSRRASAAAVIVACALVAPGLAAAQTRPATPQGPAGTVTLPVGDYDRLVDRAAQPRPVDDAPPVPSVVGRADLRARVTGTAARGTLRLEGEVFQRGAVKVPLVTGATLLDARADGRSLPLVQDGDVHAAVLTGPGTFTITLDWAADVTASPGRASLTLPRPTAGSATAVIEFPGDPADVRVDRGLIVQRTTAGGITSVEMTLSRTARTQVSWSVRESSAAPAPAEVRTLADVKSLVTIGDADLRMVTLVEITVVRGEPRTFAVQIPPGYEFASATGTSLESTEPRPGVVSLLVREPERRRHQFLISFEQPHGGGSFKIDTAFPAVAGVQRETGETAVEGTGTIEVIASADDTMRRIDVRETHASLRALARQPILAAFRYQRRLHEARVLTLDVKRFADAPVIAAVAEQATATTLVTSEGRMLTEISLRLRNRAQPFMKVTLPPGATMLSVEVAGETAKPVLGADGTRVPLLRSGLRPDGPYSVSFVYLHSGQAFAKRGESQMMLPKLDVPVSVLEWELFLPDRYSTKPVAGNVLPAALVPAMDAHIGYGGGTGGRSYISALSSARAGQIIGRVTDSLGGVLPGVKISVIEGGRAQRTAFTDADGTYVVDNVPNGTITVTSELSGFRSLQRTFSFDGRARRLDLEMAVNALTETVTVTAEVPYVDRRESERAADRKSLDAVQQSPSQNVINLQRRVAGVLPVRIDVPRTGTLHRFVRPLVLEEETTVTFRYKTLN
jgi:Carboxypeptidase regulatory-like domain